MVEKSIIVSFNFIYNDDRILEKLNKRAFLILIL